MTAYPIWFSGGPHCGVEADIGGYPPTYFFQYVDVNHILDLNLEDPSEDEEDRLHTYKRTQKTTLEGHRVYIYDGVQ